MLHDDVLTDRHSLSLLAEDALQTVALESVRSLQINDAALADELRQALATVAQGRDASKRPVTLTFIGRGPAARPHRLPDGSARVADVLSPGPGLKLPDCKAGRWCRIRARTIGMRRI